MGNEFYKGEALLKRRKIVLELIKELKYEQINKKIAVKIYTNNRWLTIDTDSKDLNTPFLQIIIEKWRKEFGQEHLSSEDIRHIESIRERIDNHFRTLIFAEIQKMMESQFETRYLNGMCFEICWRKQKYEFKIVEHGNYIRIKEMDKINRTFLSELKYEIEDELDVTLTRISIKRNLSIYLETLYKKTMEYKLKSIYK
jgi:antitoxin component HigA of HigAB toxin-antitoxin module